MEKLFIFFVWATRSFFGRVASTLAVLQISISSPAQNLFESDWGGDCIREFTPNGVSSTFGSGFNEPTGPFQVQSRIHPTV
jgi:hypothetical protein